MPAYPLLGQLQRSLVFSDLKQFNNSLLVRCKTAHILDEVSDKLYTLVQSLQEKDKTQRTASIIVHTSTACLLANAPGLLLSFLQGVASSPTWTLYAPSLGQPPTRNSHPS